MKKWNMIIDVAECTNCNLCTLATMDEYVGNDWPGYSKPMPKHGHKWINILQKERGQVPMIDIAYVPTMCNHCDDAPCLAKGEGAVSQARRRHHAHRSGQGEGPQGPGRRLPVRAHLVERGASGAADLDVRRPSHRSGLAADPRTPVVSDRRDARDQDRGRRDGADGARGGPRSDEARARAPSRASITATSGAIRNASSAARWRRRPAVSSIASRARASGSTTAARCWRRRRATTTATSSSTGWTRIRAATCSRFPRRAGAKKTIEAKLGASVNLGEIRL